MFSLRHGPLSRSRQVAGAVLLVLYALPALAEITVRIEGIADETVAKQVRIFVGAPEDGGAETLRGFVREAPQRARRALEAVGYYHARVDVNLDGEEVRIDVALGEPVSIASLDLRVNGEARADAEFQRVVAQPGLASGQIFDHGRYEALKNRLLDLAQRRGYFDARFSTHEVTVVPAERTAAVSLHLDSGIRYAIGELRFDPAPVDAAFLHRWVPFETGTPYESRLVLELTNTLLDSGYFNSVNVTPQRDQADGRLVPLKVELQPQEPNIVGLGVGFATDTGPRARATWFKPYVTRSGHSLRMEAAGSQVRDSLSTRYRIPSQADPATRYYQVEGATRSEDFQDTKSATLSAAIRRVRATDNGWQENVYLRWEQEEFRLDDENRSTTLYIPGISWSRTKRRGSALNPRWGTRYSLRTEAASRELASDIDMQKIVVSAKLLQPVLDRHRLLLRADLGALATDDFDRLPTSERFFTGGDQSIRGFAYRSIAPEDDDGTLIGGRYLTVGSAEFVWQFTDAWGAAVFLDGGRAYTDPDEPGRIGVGFGMRWESLIGTLRVDLAFGVSEDDVPARLHITIGPDL